MNALNGAATAVFNILLTPLEALGEELALILVSGIFGILALICFKHISSQKGIKMAKDKIKGHMIEIRLYQDDLLIVTKAIGKVLLRNLQYLTFNFGPILPLLVPFTFVAAQLVVRYSFEPLQVQAVEDVRLAGEGVTIQIDMRPGEEKRVSDLSISLPGRGSVLAVRVCRRHSAPAADWLACTVAGCLSATLRCRPTPAAPGLGSQCPSQMDRAHPGQYRLTLLVFQFPG